MDLSTWVERNARFGPSRPALRWQGRSLDYAAFAGAVRRAAAALARCGVGVGERVAFLGLNDPSALALFFACARVGAIFVPLNWRLAVPELARVLADCRPVALFVEETFAETARNAAGEVRRYPLSELEREGPAPGARGGPDVAVLISYTSGSTGAPKGVVLSQRAIQWNAVNSAHLHDLTSADRVLTTLPLFHVGGLNIQTTPALHAGATVVLHAKFEAREALAAIAAERVTLAVLVPAQLVALMELADWESADLSTLRMITTGSTIVTANFIRRVSARGVPVVQVYGATETCPIAAYVRAEQALAKAGSAGAAALHCELRVVDPSSGREAPPGTVGEILVRGPNLADGYWNAPHETAGAFAGGWYHSGDLGYLDNEGYLTVVGRRKELIISGGENIYPAEVENALLEHPAVGEVCVIGVPDAHSGEAVKLFVVKRDATLTEDDVAAFCRERLTGYKRPKYIEFREELPKSNVGKILRRELRDADVKKAA